MVYSITHLNNLKNGHRPNCLCAMCLVVLEFSHILYLEGFLISFACTCKHLRNSNFSIYIQHFSCSSDFAFQFSSKMALITYALQAAYANITINVAAFLRVHNSHCFLHHSWYSHVVSIDGDN